MWSLSAVILKPKKIKFVTSCTSPPPFICHEVMGPDAMILVFLFLFYFHLSFFTVELQASFDSPLSPLSWGSLVPLPFLPLERLKWLISVNIQVFLLWLFFLTAPQSSKDLSSLTRDWTWAPAVNVLRRDHWPPGDSPNLPGFHFPCYLSSAMESPQ